MATISIISCEMQHNQLVSRSFVEDFNAKSQLIVDQSQEAIFFKDGQALDLFGAGRHSLDTNNLPLFKRLISKMFGLNNNIFSCHVYFINKTTVLDAFWGTSAPILVEDPKEHLPAYLRANGQMGVHIKDSRKFIVKVVGQLPECDTDSVKRAIQGTINSIVKTVIASAIMESGISVLELNTMLTDLSDRIMAKINERLDDYGLLIENFAIDALLLDENDLAQIRKVKQRRVDAWDEADLEAYKIDKLSQARARARAVEGYTYQEERKFDVLDSAAKNEGGMGGDFINMGVGLGVGVGVSREVGNMFNGTSQPQNVQPQGFQPAQSAPTTAPKFCSNCGTPCTPGARFCSNCGFKLF